MEAILTKVCKTMNTILVYLLSPIELIKITGVLKIIIKYLGLSLLSPFQAVVGWTSRSDVNRKNGITILKAKIKEQRKKFLIVVILLQRLFPNLSVVVPLFHLYSLGYSRSLHNIIH